MPKNRSVANSSRRTHKGLAPPNTSSAEIIAKWRLPSAVSISIAGSAPASSISSPVLSDPVLQNALRKANIVGIERSSSSSDGAQQMLFHPQPFEGYQVTALGMSTASSHSSSLFSAFEPKVLFNLAASVVFYGGTCLTERDAIIALNSSPSPDSRLVIVVDETFAALAELAMTKWALSAASVFHEILERLRSEPTQNLMVTMDTILAAADSLQIQTSTRLTDSAYFHRLNENPVLLLGIQQWKYDIVARVGNALGLLSTSNASITPLLMTLGAIQQCLNLGVSPAMAEAAGVGQGTELGTPNETAPVRLDVANILFHQTMLLNTPDDYTLPDAPVGPQTLPCTPRPPTKTEKGDGLTDTRLGHSGAAHNSIWQTPDARTPMSGHHYYQFIDRDDEEESAPILNSVSAARELFASGSPTEIRQNYKPSNTSSKKRDRSRGHQQELRTEDTGHHRRVTFPIYK